MTEYPRDRRERIMLRSQHAQRLLAEARQLAALYGRSMKCQGPAHAGEPYGCGNDGSTCLCACHDVVTAPTA